jgi:hypothetical protein
MPFKQFLAYFSEPLINCLTPPSPQYLSYIVTAQINQTRVGVTRQLVSNPPPHKKLLDHFKTNLILTQLDEICKQKLGCHKKN